MDKATRWRYDGWGARARIGLLTPHMDIVPEGEFRALAPHGVSVHVARVPLGWRSGGEPAPIGLDAVRAFAQPPHVDTAAELLAGAPIDVIVYAFTSSSYLLGPAADVELKQRLEDRGGGIPVVVQCQAVLLALRALGVGSLAVVNPPWFPDELSDMGARYFRDAGIEVEFAASASGVPPVPDRVQPGDVHAWVRSHVPDTAGAVFLGGGGLRAIGAVEALEQSLERPVLTANQVAFWQALRVAGIDDVVSGYGQIFTHTLPG